MGQCPALGHGVGSARRSEREPLPERTAVLAAMFGLLTGVPGVPECAASEVVTGAILAVSSMVTVSDCLAPGGGNDAGGTGRWSRGPHLVARAADMPRVAIATGWCELRVARRVFWLGGLFGAAVSVVFFVILLTGVLGERGTVIVDDYLCWVVPVLAGLACVRRGWRQATDTVDRRRSGWVLMGISCLSWGGGGLIWTIYEVHLGQEVPYPSLADVGYLLAVPPAIVGLGLLSGAGRGLGVRLRDVADGAVAGTALLFISWATVLGPLFADSGSGLLSHAIGLAYPTSDVLTATVALLAVARARGTHRTVMTLLGLGLAAVAVSDSSFTWFTSQGSYATGNLFDTGYVVGYLLIALAALHPGGALTGGSQDQPSRVAMALPYVPIFAVGVVGAVLNLAYRPLGPFLYWDGAAMLALIMGRQLLSLSANQSLSLQLQDTITTLQEREHELAHRAFHDDLTGLPNRAMFHELLTSELLGPSWDLSVTA